MYDYTTITIQPQNGSSFEVALPDFGTFTSVSFDNTDPIASGTRITSDAPITVVSGNLCETNSLDFGVYLSSIPPITIWHMSIMSIGFPT